MSRQGRVELFSGRVKKVRPDNVSEERYDFLKLSEAEPDLGVPSTTDSSNAKRFLLTDKDGTRYWSDTLLVDSTHGSQNLIATTEIEAPVFSTNEVSITDNTIYTKGSGVDLNLATNSGGLVKFNSAMGVNVGQPSLGRLVSRAVRMTTTSTVSNGIAQLNYILGKLVPPNPPSFPNNETLAIQGLVTYRMCDFTQIDNTNNNRNVAGGTTVSVIKRDQYYATNYITGCGPGTEGVVTAYRNDQDVGNHTMTDTQGEVSLIGDDNGTFGELNIANDQDYSLITTPPIATTFWQSFDARALGTVTEGWHEVYIDHTAASHTNTAYWYADLSSPGTPSITNYSLTAPGIPLVSYSSTIPHYTTSNTFTLEFDVNKLSGDTYPTSDTFITGTAGGAFNAPVNVTYLGAGVTTPLARNLYVNSGSVTVTTTAQIKSGFGSNSNTCSIAVNNGYNIGTRTFAPGAMVLFKTGTGTNIDETNIPVASFGSGSGNALRIINPGSNDTPTITSTSAFNSETSTLETYDAVVVGSGNQGVIKHDQTDYSTGYLPAGPDLSIGRSGSQYFTFKYTRSAVSKFDIQFTGTVAGMWVALPGSTIDNSSTLNGWVSMTTAYAGSGAPGANIGGGGNGSNGCALGGIVQINSSGTQRRTCTFGTVSSSSTSTKEIVIRIKLTTGQSITALSILGSA
jgi:hypothetical protein